MHTSDPVYTAGMTPPDPPTATQVVSRGTSRQPCVRSPASQSSGSSSLRDSAGSGLAQSSALSNLATVSLFYIGWDFYYFANAERAVRERQAWERAQSLVRVRAKSAGPGGSSGADAGGSSEAEMEDPWA